MQTLEDAPRRGSTSHHSEETAHGSPDIRGGDSGRCNTSGSTGWTAKLLGGDAVGIWLSGTPNAFNLDNRVLGLRGGDTHGPTLHAQYGQGGKAVGMRIFHGMSQKWVKPCLMELGGKNPAIIMDSADLDAATGHDVVLTVRGEHNALSSASWVQLAAVQLTVHRA